MMGHGAAQWVVVQEAHYCSFQSKHTGQSWMKALLKRLMTTAWDMWADRNNIRHSSSSTRAVEEMQRLDNITCEEIAAGEDNLVASVVPTYRTVNNGYNGWTRDHKIQWIESVQRGRIADQINVQHATLAQPGLVQTTLTDFFLPTTNNGPTPIVTGPTVDASLLHND